MIAKENNAKSIHLPGLNGLRAIAALSVMWGHTFQSTFGNWGVEGPRLSFVADGVTLFFVISGFLITFLLLKEQAHSQKISIPKFYMRRVLRIWPIYYLYMLLAVLITSTWKNPNMWYYCFFAANIPFILSVGIWPIVHYWSIGVEEQFYLFWPWLVKMINGKNKKLIIIASVLCGVWLACKWGSYLFFGTTSLYRFFAVTRFDCMMVGAVGAALYYENNVFISRVFEKKWLGLICFMALLFSQFWVGYFPAPLRPQVIAVLSLTCIFGQLYSPIINLENRFCDFVGKISYGIYVIHPLLIFFLSGLYLRAGITLPIVQSSLLIYFIVTTMTILVAWLSYRFFESPFLRLKNKFAVVHSRNTMN